MKWFDQIASFRPLLIQSLSSCISEVCLRRLFSILIFVILTFSATAQTPAASLLNDYQGHYEYEGQSTLDMVAGKDLFAILDEAKYKLPASGTDTFLNGAGEKIVFRRDANGIVTGFEEHGHFYHRLSPQ